MREENLDADAPSSVTLPSRLLVPVSEMRPPSHEEQIELLVLSPKLTDSW